MDMQHPAPGTGRHLARDWRALARKQRLEQTAVMAFVIGLLWLMDWAEGDGATFSLANWPLSMPLLFVLGGILATGRMPRGGGTDYRLAGFLAGDRSVIDGYPPVVQAALLRAVEAGAERSSLLPPTHRLLWRLGLPMPPVAFSPAWLDALVLFAAMYVAVPLWLQVQLWWNADFGGESLRLAAGVLTVLFAIFAALFAAYRASRRKGLGLPTWREFRQQQGTAR